MQYMNHQEAARRVVHGDIISRHPRLWVGWSSAEKTPSLAQVAPCYTYTHMSHVSSIWVMSPLYELCLSSNESRLLYIRKDAISCTSRAVLYIYTYESRLLYMSHVSTNGSCLTWLLYRRHNHVGDMTSSLTLMTHVPTLLPHVLTTADPILDRSEHNGLKSGNVCSWESSQLCTTMVQSWVTQCSYYYWEAGHRLTRIESTVVQETWLLYRRHDYIGEMTHVYTCPLPTAAV
jgi:hypothetical protein